MKKIIYSLIILTSVAGAAAPSHMPALQPITEIFSPSGDFPSNKFWKVAVIQWNPPGSAPLGVPADAVATYKQQVHQLMIDKIKEAASNGAQFIVLSEFAAIGYPDIPELPPEEDNYRNRDDIAPYVETIPGATTNEFGAVAKQLGVWIQFGLAEVDSTTQKYYDSAVAINASGEVVGKYRKHHLFEIEDHFLAEGAELATFSSPAGLIGMILCSDIYYEPVLQAYAQLHLDGLVLSTSWAEQNTGMDNFKAAAMEVHAPLMAANQNYFPDSGVINADGSFQSHIRQSRNAIAYGFLPLK